MSLVRVQCPTCRTSYKITEGKRGRCPRCQIMLVPVPAAVTVRDVKPLRRAPEDAPTVVTRRPRWRLAVACLLFGAVVLVGAGLLFSIGIHFPRPSPQDVIPNAQPAADFDGQLAELTLKIKNEFDLLMKLHDQLPQTPHGQPMRELIRLLRDRQRNLEMLYGQKEAVLRDRMAIKGVQPGDHKILETCRWQREGSRDALAEYDRWEHDEDTLEALKAFRGGQP